MKILIVGNSHVGSLKRAWDIVKPDYSSQYELHFAAARGKSLENAIIEDGKLFSENPHVSKSLEYTYGKETVDFKELMPDRVLVYGCGLVFSRFLKTYRSFEKGHYSEKCKDIALYDAYRTACGFHLAHKIQKNYRKSGRILVTAPAPAEEKLATNTEKYIETDQQEMEVNEISDLVNFSNKSFFEKFGLRYVLQPEETMAENYTLTLHKYSVGSKVLEVGKKNDSKIHNQADRNHMNDEFGKLYLEALFSKLEQNII